MDEAFEKWCTAFESGLAMAPKPVRETVPTVLERIRTNNPQLLNKQPLRSDKAIASAAKNLSQMAQTQEELDVTTHILLELYDYHSDMRASLSPPTVRASFNPLLPLINERSIPVAIVEYLTSFLYGDHSEKKCDLNSLNRDKKKKYSAKHLLGRAIVMVAYKSGLNTLAEVEALMAIPPSDYIVIPEQNLVSIYLPTLHRRVYLFGEAMLAMYLISGSEYWKKTQHKRRNQIRSIIKHWLSSVESSCKHYDLKLYINTLSVPKLLREIGLLDGAIGLSELWQGNHALNNPSFIRAMTGECVLNESSEENSDANLSDTVIQKNLDLRGDGYRVGTQQQLDEIDAHRTLNQILEEYEKNDPNQRRNTRHFKKARTLLLELTKKPLAWRTTLVVNWITTLFIYGSPWKEKLAVGSLLTYHSTLKSFVQAAWFDLDLIHCPTNEFGDLCQYGLDHFERPSSQYTVIRFLRYCQQYTSFPKIDLDMFDVVSIDGVIRAHYIPPTLFDEVCLQFCMGKGIYEQQITLFMELCYYAGLREDEALTLKCRDIDFETRILYVTDEKQRKTPHAVRKIPLALIPESILSKLANAIDERLALSPKDGDSPELFSDWAFAMLETQFIDFIRQYLNDDTIVTHSLRHCAANNWTILLALIAFDKPNPSHCYLFNHVLFSDKQKKIVSEMFKSNGCRMTAYFPVLEWVSARVGHAGPSTTFSVYLHLIDWLSLYLTDKSRKISKTVVRSWVSSNNYGFERQKRLFLESNDYSAMGELAPAEVTAFFAKKFKNSKHYSSEILPREENLTTITPKRLSFSAFTLEAQKQHQNASDSQCHSRFVRWLNVRQAMLPNLSITQEQSNSWLRLCQQLDRWQLYDLPKIKQLTEWFDVLHKTVRGHQRITRRSSLTQIVNAYLEMNLSPLAIKISGRQGCKALTHWSDWLENKGVAHIVATEDEKTSAVLRPYKLRWPLWRDIDHVVTLITCYLDYWQFEEGVMSMNK